MSRYVRVNTLPGFSDVRYFYWFDHVENKVLSFPNKIRSFDPNVNTIYGASGVIGSRQCGDTRYNFVTNGRYNQSAQLRKIMQAYARLMNTPVVHVAQQEVAAATVSKAKFAVIRLANNAMVARDLDEAAARKVIETRVKNNGGDHMLVQQVAIAKATSCVAWG